jgi:BirA family biotin operon repressor/biotin-[acetyl-CoA-carboxylase] ligase
MNMKDKQTLMSIDKQQYLIARLADGKFHSGESLAQEMGISRAAVWKRIQTLADMQLDIYSVNGKGHRLSQPLEVLNTNTIEENLSIVARATLADLTVLQVVSSTSEYLHTLLNNQSIHASVVLAEYQNKGKGRRGKQWVSPYASGLCISLGWHFDSTPASYTALSLATGVAVCKSLQGLGIQNVGLKWPNDIVSDGKKLGGILLESRSETAGCSDVVIGIGINVNLPEKSRISIQQAVIDLNGISQTPVSRNTLSAAVIEELFTMLEQYQQHGFSSCISQWRELDAYKGKEADLILPNETLKGEILGIDENGLLLMRVNGETCRFSSGELSLRVH